MEQNKIAFITGASSGIGLSIAKYFSTKGYKVYGTSRSERHDNDIHFIKMDVNDEQSVNDGFQAFCQQENRIDLLINCAGLGIIGTVEEMPMEEIRAAFETNFYGPVRLCQKFIPMFRAQRSGTIVNVSSVVGQVGLPFRGYYAASKFALEGLTESLRMELKPFGIKTILLQPGDFNTNIASARRGISTPDDSPYYQALADMDKQIEEGMNKSPKPDNIGPFLYNKINKSNPKPRYAIGILNDIIAIPLKRYLPQRLFEKLIMGFYNLNNANPDNWKRKK
ncbi:SDR family oxidoreductase [Prolixibacteraceae bacterium JC049]|nr:SDR family oxidoreductase [Prolixibacteraceae bacterium JC049]